MKVPVNDAGSVVGNTTPAREPTAVTYAVDPSLALILTEASVSLVEIVLVIDSLPSGAISVPSGKTRVPAPALTLNVTLVASDARRGLPFWSTSL